MDPIHFFVYSGVKIRLNPFQIYEILDMSEEIKL